MAGKTFSGIGVEELLRQNPPLGPEDAAPDPETEDARGVYSGPTVVDDEKVAEGLERLKSLDLPDTTTGDVIELVTDSSSSEPTRIGAHHPRATAVGRSPVTDVPGQHMVVHTESLRGTMFGHSIHRPDVQPPLEPEDLSPSGPVYVPPSPDRSVSRPDTTQMVPYQPQVQQRATPEQSFWQGEAVQPFPRAHVYAPGDDDETRRATPPRFSRRAILRAVGFGLGLVLLFGGAYAVMRFRADPDEASDPPDSPAATQPRKSLAPAAVVQPSLPPAVPAPRVPEPAPVPATAPERPRPAAPEPAFAPRPAPKTTTVPAAPTTAPATAPAEPLDEAAARRKAARAERRRAQAEEAAAAGAAGAAPTAPAVAPAPPKPSGKKKTPLEEDPDATLPPSTIE